MHASGRRCRFCVAVGQTCGRFAMGLSHVDGNRRWEARDLCDTVHPSQHCITMAVGDREKVGNGWLVHSV